MKLCTSLALAGLLITAAACGDDSRRGRTDGGSDGAIILMDGGGGGDSSTRPDATTTDSGTGTCPPQTIPAPTEAVCANSTLTCIMGCMDQACLEACFMADPNPDACIGCTNDAIIACATTMGCDDEAGEIICCGMENCPTADAMCLQSMCAAQYSTFDTCIQGVASGCVSSIGVCFMSS